MTKVIFVVPSTDADQSNGNNFVLVLKYASEPTGSCIQVGKFQTLGGNGEVCTNYFEWDTEWLGNVTSGTVFTADIDVSSASYTFPPGDYSVFS